ncbi:MAG: dihydroorotate dehydrogenase [Thermoplasmata archaeon]|nr:MAG: dihydroorotate dehydrogenase [Thermoplasmata archaeon]
MVDISVRISRIHLKNPTILASGIMGSCGQALKRIAEEGEVGALVTKSIGKEQRKGYPNPTAVELECGILNAMGLPNPGIDAFGEELKELEGVGIPVIGSIFGKDAEEFVFLAKKMEGYGVDALEINMSCPHAKGYGLEVGSDPVLVEEIVREIKKNVKIPLFVKLSANLTNIVDIGKVAEKEGADALVAINSVKAMKIDVDLMKPILYNKIGGYSGKGIKPIGVRCVYELAKEIKIPIIGVGGITDWRDAIEYILAGAKAVQVGSGIFYRGIKIFREISEGIRKWMMKKGFEKIDDFRGLALE